MTWAGPASGVREGAEGVAARVPLVLPEIDWAGGVLGPPGRNFKTVEKVPQVYPSMLGFQHQSLALRGNRHFPGAVCKSLEFRRGTD